MLYRGAAVRAHRQSLGPVPHLRRLERRRRGGGGGGAGADRHRHRWRRVEPHSGGVLPHDLTPDGFGNQSHITPMAGTVMDTAVMLQAMAGPHPSDPHSLGLAAPDFVAAAQLDGDLSGIRIGWRPYLGNDRLAAEV